MAALLEAWLHGRADHARDLRTASELHLPQPHRRGVRTPRRGARRDYSLDLRRGGACAMRKMLTWKPTRLDGHLIDTSLTPGETAELRRLAAGKGGLEIGRSEESGGGEEG